MFQQTTFKEVIIKYRNRDKEDSYFMNLSVNQIGQINLHDVIEQIQDLVSIQEGFFFYLNHSQDRYISIENHEQLLYVPLSWIVKENIIHLRFEPKISDEFLAKNQIKPECIRSKRSRERIIADVFLVVESWRFFYLEGIENQKGQRQKINLDQSASMIDIPRKTLQDYFLLLRNGINLGFDFKNHAESKVGILRSFVKQHKKREKEQKKNIKQRQILKYLRRQLFGITVQEIQNEVFNNYGSSDEDLIFDQN